MYQFVRFRVHLWPLLLANCQRTFASPRPEIKVKLNHHLSRVLKHQRHALQRLGDLVVKLRSHRGMLKPFAPLHTYLVCSLALSKERTASREGSWPSIHQRYSCIASQSLGLKQTYRDQMKLCCYHSCQPLDLVSLEHESFIYAMRVEFGNIKLIVNRCHLLQKCPDVVLLNKLVAV